MNPCACGCGEMAVNRFRQGHNTRHTPESFARTFWRRVDRRGPDECWPWLGTTNGSDGRGKVHLGFVGDYRLKKRKQAYAYVVAWQLTKGPIPDGLFVLHNCPTGDNPNCVNPAHLFLGTQVDNIHDMQRKGRANNFGWKDRLTAPTASEWAT